jgi:hypothetical protein
MNDTSHSKTIAFEQEVIGADVSMEPSFVRYEIENSEDITVLQLLDHFSNFLVACGFSKYEFDITGSNAPWVP